jgi:hypothetical protein
MVWDVCCTSSLVVRRGLSVCCDTPGTEKVPIGRGHTAGVQAGVRGPGDNPVATCLGD